MLLFSLFNEAWNTWEIRTTNNMNDIQ